MTRRELARLLDHSVLKPESTEAEIFAGAELVRQWAIGFYCVQPSFVSVAVGALQGSGARVVSVDLEACNGCSLCFRVGCPAILKSAELDEHYQRSKALIVAELGTGCEVCAQVCPRDAITFRVEQQTAAEVAA